MAMTPDLEALTDRTADEALFCWQGRIVSTAAFTHDALALAATLPDAGHIVNLCRDRYTFAVGFAAALLRRQVSLLSGDQSIAGLYALRAKFPGVIGLSDDCVAGPLPVYPVRPAGVPPIGPAAVPSVPASQLAAIVFTSGSTGDPVPHRKLWGALVARSRAAATAFQLRSTSPGTIVATVPPHHMYGFELTVLLPLHAPVASWCDAAFFPGDVHAALMAVPGPRILVTTPLQVRALLHAGTGLPPLAAAISATAPLDPALAMEAELRWQAPMMEIFGATEVGSIASRRTLDGDEWTAYPGVSLRADADGTIVDAPWAEPTALADRIEPSGPNRFRLLGRRTDLVKLGGRRASLSGLNQVLLALDGVADGTFVAPDDLEVRANARLSAIVVAPRRSPGDIVADLRGRIDPLFMPRRVVCVESLPRNALGKLPRQALLDLLAAAP